MLYVLSDGEAVLLVVWLGPQGVSGVHHGQGPGGVQLVLGDGVDCVSLLGGVYHVHCSGLRGSTSCSSMVVGALGR